MKPSFKLASSFLLAVLGVISTSTFAAEPDSCHNVRFADIGWTDISATTGVAATLFSGLGYNPTKTIVSVPISFAGLKSKQLDISLGYWSPVQTQMVEPLAKAKNLVVLERPNLVGAKATLVVPDYVAEGGIKSIADIAKYKKELDGKIIGIEPGSSANAKIQGMIDRNEFGLGDFKLVQSSEAGMLSEVQRDVRQKKWVVFLGWEPHPMNLQMKLTYLTGGDTVFGPNFGEAKVYTLVATDYMERCPNAGKLVSNLEFNTDMENHLMASIMDKAEPNSVAKAYLKKNPQLLDKWLTGVKTFDGKDGLPAVKKYLGL
jgi:glycine betaine/proline transport system substrate-binding protein